MIPPGTTFTGPLRVRLDHILFTQHERRYPRCVQHYYRLLTDPRHAHDDAGVVMLTPYGPDGYYTPLDGHHRCVAAFLAGRCDVLALIQTPPPMNDDIEA